MKLNNDVACARQHLELPSFSAHGHNLATELFQSVAPPVGTLVSAGI